MVLITMLFAYETRLHQKMAKNPSFFVGIFLLMVCWTGMTDAKYYKYKDPKMPINVRVKDLLNRMTLEEKIGQMVQIDRCVASAEVMKKYFIGKSHIN